MSVHKPRNQKAHCDLENNNRLGAVEIRRRDFLRTLDVALSLPDRAGLWRLDPCLQII